MAKLIDGGGPVSSLLCFSDRPAAPPSNWVRARFPRTRSPISLYSQSGVIESEMLQNLIKENVHD